MDGEMISNPAGAMIQTVWDEIPFHYAGTEIDEFVVMPNHIHGIIIITRSVVVPSVGAGPCTCPLSGHARGVETGQPRGIAPYGNNRENGDVVIAGYCASVQNDDHQTISVGSNNRMASVFRQIMAT